MERLPIIDFSRMSVDKSEDSLENGHIEQLAVELMEAFTTIGFVYLTNHGLSKELIQDIRALSKEFFSQPMSVKDKYVRKELHGYMATNSEITDYEEEYRNGDLKECFDVQPGSAETWPEEVNRFRERASQIYSAFELLARRILTVIASGLGIQPDVLLSVCANGSGLSLSTLRILHYPPLPDDTKVPQMRLAEHTDYGAMTILLQDDVGGLEVKTPSGDWIEATPVPEALLVNIADLMQRWSSDKLKSTMHRVVIPEDKSSWNLERFSTAFFLHPDRDAVIKCLDGGNMYPPIKAGEFADSRFSVVYGGEYTRPELEQTHGTC